MTITHREPLGGDLEILITDADPNGVESAAKGAISIDGAAGTVHVNTDGATAWSRIDTAAKPSCSATRTGVLTVSDDSSTIVPFDAEQWDTDSMHEGVTNPSRVTIRTAGKYLITTGIMWEASAAGRRDVVIVKNGALPVIGQQLPAGAGDEFNSVSALADAAVSDYFEVSVKQTSGGDLDIVVSPLAPVLQAIKLSD